MTSLFTRAELAAYQKLLRPILFRWAGGDPEAIHEAMISWLGHVPATRSVTVAGIEFPNRIGVAAGLDKDGVAAAAWARFGFGHAELGTVTGQAQPGNPRPRMFRARASQGVINRMGFNNRGADALADRLLKLGVQRGNRRLGIPLGVSIGKTKAIALVDAASDYLASLDALRDHADYFAVNVSSPNTPGLRSLQAAKELEQLLGCIIESASQGTDPVPVFVKLAPDLEPGQLTETLGIRYGIVRKIIQVFLEAVVRHLLSGRSVCLHPLGTLRISFTSDGMEEPEQITPYMIRDMKIVITPDKLLKEQLSNLHFELNEDPAASSSPHESVVEMMPRAYPRGAQPWVAP